MAPRSGVDEEASLDGAVEVASRSRDEETLFSNGIANVFNLFQVTNISSPLMSKSFS